MPSKSLSLIGLIALVGALGCKPKTTTNQDLLNQYSGSKYESDMVATDYETVEDQGDSIDPRTQAAIQDTITTVYVTDFEKCLETEMSRLENRWIAGDFAVDLTIETSGMVSAVKFLEVDIKERKTLNDKGEFVSEGGKAPRKADNFESCAEAKIYKWEFDPPPEVTYTHSYNGRVGEAW
ncbi:MAG TPA: hypothetical protein VK034_25125 [Enhygromyxa sp.]|nr:hypothetical protein [Enhygromyxa sp.]